ncbi:MAG: hypothetical protein OXU20_20740 [Myxococcales bacterium]|nr:hypothetical protein [Myxococcales bacterium]MDD9965290.1 hypothetical protein [Myxococcales bacterium]
MPNQFSKIAKESASKTNRQLKDDLARVLPMSDRRLNELLPSKQDKERAAELMAIVNGAANHNRKVTKLIENIDQLAGVTVKLLSHLT